MGAPDPDFLRRRSHFRTVDLTEEAHMKQEFRRKGPLLRFAFAIAAVSITLSIAGFIDFLATIYPADARHGFVVAGWK